MPPAHPTLALLLFPLAACGVGTVNATGGPDSSPDAAVSESDPDAAAELDPFSFFVTSLDTMREQSGSQDGFGGDLGGLSGADAICQSAASAIGFGAKTWRAFLSVNVGPEGTPVHAIDRIGEGPWYDRNGFLLAMNKADLLQERPAGDARISEDLPDETGQGLKILFEDAHDVLTGSNIEGKLDSPGNLNATCNDWTSAVGPGTEGQVRAGHAWPANSGQHWIRAHTLRGCAAGVNLQQDGAGTGDCVGCSGGYGGIYCFALTP